MQDPVNAIAIFCARYGLDYERIAHDRESNYLVIGNLQDAFDGRVAALRVRNYGQFGNRFYQLLNAMLLARQLGCAEIQMNEFAGGPESYPVAGGEIDVVLTTGADISRPILEGNYFAPVGFEPLLEPMQPAFMEETVRHFVKPVFRRFAADGDAGRDDELVVHFRGGDFREKPGYVHPYYVCPPVSFYTRAVQFAFDKLGVRRVRLVSEDRNNPAIEGVEAFLRANAVPAQFQSTNMADDFRALLYARHLVVPFSTFTETAALLSSTLRTYIAFRDLEAHAFMYRRPYSLLEAVLDHRGVGLYVVDDIDGNYIPRRAWAKTAPQLELIRSYPETSLRLNRKIVAPTWSFDTRPRGLVDGIAAAREEASRCRAALREANAEIERLRNDRDALRKELEKLAVLAREFGWVGVQPTL